MFYHVHGWKAGNPVITVMPLTARGKKFVTISVCSHSRLAHLYCLFMNRAAGRRADLLWPCGGAHRAHRRALEGSPVNTCIQPLPHDLTGFNFHTINSSADVSSKQAWLYSRANLEPVFAAKLEQLVCGHLQRHGSQHDVHRQEHAAIDVVLENKICKLRLFTGFEPECHVRSVVTCVLQHLNEYE